MILDLRYKKRSFYRSFFPLLLFTFPSCFNFSVSHKNKALMCDRVLVALNCIPEHCDEEAGCEEYQANFDPFKSEEEVKSEGAVAQVEGQATIKKEVPTPPRPLCKHCKSNFRKIKILANWIHEDDLFEFKDSAGRNKLMILASELKSSKKIKELIVSQVINILKPEFGKDKFFHFDSPDIDGNKTCSHLIASGMISHFLELISVVKGSSSYDFGLLTSSLLEGGISPICLLALQIREKKELEEIMWRIQNLERRLFSDPIDKDGNSLAIVAVLFENTSLFEYIIENERKDNMRMMNSANADALSASIKYHKYTFTKAILRTNLFDFRGNDKIYGRDLLIYASACRNLQALRMLVAYGADISAGDIRRFLRKVGKVALDAIASFADLGVSYGSYFVLGPAIKGSFAADTLNSVRRNFANISKVGFSLTEAEEQAAVKFAKDFIYADECIDLDKFNEELLKLRRRIKSKLQEFNSSNPKVKQIEEKVRISSKIHYFNECVIKIDQVGDILKRIIKRHSDANLKEFNKRTASPSEIDMWHDILNGYKEIWRVVEYWCNELESLTTT